MPSILTNDNAELVSGHKDVISLDKRNYQMFAFCPGIDQKKCGISEEGVKNHDFNVPALETE